MRQAGILVLTVALGACASGQKTTTAPIGAESNIQVCVVDTIAPGGMMTVSAIHAQATHDTLILQREGRVKIHEAVAGPKVLSQAAWISARQPLQLTSANGRVRYAQAGKPKALAPGRIVLLGMMRGLPVFALPSEGGAMRAELESLAARGIDLEKSLQQRATLRRQLVRVRTLYVPTSLVGCVFQQFTRAPAPRR